MNDVTKSEQPHDRLTGLCAEMTTPLDRDENSDVRAIVMLNDESRGGIQLHGYEDETEAMVELLMHMKAVFAANGKRLDFMALDNDGVDRV